MPNTRRSVRLQSKVTTPHDNIQVPEVTSSTPSKNQTKKIDITSEDQLSTETSTCPIKENLDQDYDSESDSPEEISFAKAKTDFIVISQTEKSAIKQNKKRRTLPPTVLSAVSEHNKQTHVTESMQSGRDDTLLDDEEDYMFEAPRIKAVSLKSLYSSYNEEERTASDRTDMIKHAKFSKVKLGPAAQFLVEHS